MIDAAIVATELGIETGKANRVIAPLADAGIRPSSPASGATRMWHSREVLAGLDDFAARAGHRR